MTRSKALIFGACLALLTGLALGVQADHHEKAEHHEQGHEMPQGQMTPEMAAAMEAWSKSMTPGEPHKWLAEQVGTYTLTITSWMDPSAPPMVSKGKAVRTMSMGGRVLEEEVTADVMGMPMEGLGRTGYDNVTGSYWSTWTDNMSTGISIFEGKVEGDTAVWEGMTSDPMTGEKGPMKIKSKYEGNTETSMFYMPGPDGEMTKQMEIVYVKQ